MASDFGPCVCVLPSVGDVNINFSKLIVALHSEDIFSATVGS